MADLYGMWFPELDPKEYMPMEAVMLIKGLSIEEDRIRYREMITPGLTPAEGLGMTTTASDTFRKMLMEGMPWPPRRWTE